MNVHLFDKEAYVNSVANYMHNSQIFNMISDCLWYKFERKYVEKSKFFSALKTKL